MGEIIDNATQKAEAKVLADLESKKIGNQPKADFEPEGLISQTLKDSHLQIDPKDGSVK